MSIGFSYTFGLDKTTLSAAVQAMGRKPGLSEFDLAKETGVGGKKGIAYNAWLMYLGLRKRTARELSSLGALLLAKDPHLDSHVSLQLLHYQLCSNPQAIVWWTLANQVIPNTDQISVDRAMESLTSRGIGVTNMKNLRSDIGIFFAAYAPGRIFAPLNYLTPIEGNIYAPGRVELNPLLFAYILYSRREGGLRTSTTTINSILSEDGQVGKIFLLTRSGVLEVLRQLEFRGLVTVAQVADLDNIGYTYEGKAFDILKTCYEGER